MLFGNKEQRDLVLETAKNYADSIGVTLIFGAMVSSVSKNCHYPDSDYDSVFLYLKEDFPNQTYVLSSETEGDLIRKCYAEDEVFEYIPFWEATSFLHQMIEQTYKMESNWYHVNWVFMSPYTWDPYGMQNRLLPLLNHIFESKNEIAYRKEELRSHRRDLDRERASTKKYLRTVHAAATIEWCLKYPECPPMDLQSLLYGLNREYLWREISNILEKARDDARKYASPAFTRGVAKDDFRRPAIVTSYNLLLIEYIDEMVRDADAAAVSEKCTKKERAAVVDLMCQLIRRSVFENEPLQYIGKSEKGK